MNTGISIYFSSGGDENRRIIDKAAECGVTYGFTSLHIPEEENINYVSEVQDLLLYCKEKHIELIIDVSPKTLAKLQVTDIHELKNYGIQYIRLDYGFSPQETVDLSKSFNVVFNASTITEQNIADWKACGADFTKFAACHNFYPKAFTGLSMDRVTQMNRRLKYLGFKTMAFVPGNKILRGPLREGLPTLEEHRERKEDLVMNMLTLYVQGGCDVVLVGDVDIEEDSWHGISCLSQGYVELRAEVDEAYSFIVGQVHHDREDASDWIFRSVESRDYNRRIQADSSHESRKRTMGSIAVSNESYLRYMGELEIARTDLPSDHRLNIVGWVKSEDCRYLPYIKNGLGIRLIGEKHVF